MQVLIARRILIFVALWLLFESAISLLATCEGAYQPSDYASGKQAKEYCSAFSGPVLASGWAFLYWLGHILEGYGEAVIAVFTIVLAFATGFLWKATRDLVRDARKTSERQLRAYVSFDLTSININPSPSGHVIEVGYILTNDGQTPAHKVRTDTSFRTMKAPIPVGDKIERPPPNALTFAPTLGPRQKRGGNITKIRPITDLEIAEMIKSGQLLYVVALITYDDVFGEERSTQYCGSLQNLAAIVAAGKAGKPIPKARFATSEQYNDAS